MRDEEHVALSWGVAGRTAAKDRQPAKIRSRHTSYRFRVTLGTAPESGYRRLNAPAVSLSPAPLLNFPLSTVVPITGRSERNGEKEGLEKLNLHDKKGSSRTERRIEETSGDGVTPTAPLALSFWNRFSGSGQDVSSRFVQRRQHIQRRSAAGRGAEGASRSRSCRVQSSRVVVKDR